MPSTVSRLAPGGSYARCAGPTGAGHATMTPMKSIAIKIIVNGVALWVAAALVSGVHLAEGRATFANQLFTVFLVAVIFGLINAVIKPVAKFFSFPFIILTLGLFTLVVNAAMLQLTSWVAGAVGLPFHVDHFFWDAVLGGLIISIVSLVLGIFLPDRD
jgi:putative membrane protein